MVASGRSRATGSELKLAPRSPNRRKHLENLGVNAKSHERSLSAFSVNYAHLIEVLATKSPI